MSHNKYLYSSDTVRSVPLGDPSTFLIIQLKAKTYSCATCDIAHDDNFIIISILGEIIKFLGISIAILIIEKYLLLFS